MRRKKNIIRLGFFVAAALIFGSCERVIHIDLNSSGKQLVIEAYVTDQPLVDTVLITQTGSYFTPGNYSKVNGATIIVTDNMGVTDTFIQVDSGKYATTHLTGIPGRTYTMKATVLGKEYDAVSTMPLPVSIDSLTSNEVGNAPDTNYHVHCYFIDPAAYTNFYKVEAYVNHVLQDSTGDIALDEDKYTNGLPQGVRLRMANPSTNDSVKVVLMCIDANTYKYFSVVKSITGASNPVSTATPQNPPTNILGGALGYFSAHTVRTASLVIP